MSRTFGDHLSGDANPPAGDVRRFRDTDIQVLAYITQGTKSGRLLADIRADLENEIADLPDITGILPQDEPTTALATDATAQAFSLVAVAIDGMHQDAQQRDTLEERITGVESAISTLEKRLTALEDASLWQRIAGKKR